jgi:type I restriction enzyme S subunit
MAAESLPTGWESKRLGDADVAVIVMGQSPPSATYRDVPEGLPFFQGKADFGYLHPVPRKWCVAAAKIAEPGDVLISVRAPVGPTNFCMQRACIGRGLAALRARPGLDSRFLLYYLRSIEHRIELLGQGSTFEAITKEDLAGLEVPVPPLEEQRHIVGRIEGLARRIEEAKGLRRAARQEAEALLPAAADEIFGSAQAQAWPVQSLGDALQDIRYGTSTKASTSGVGVPVIRMGNIQDGGLVLDDLKYLELPAGEVERLLLERGDILVNRTNSPELVGKSAVFEEPGQYVFASYLIRMRLHLQKAEPRLVCAYINSRRGRDYVASRRKQVTGQANINSGTLRSMPIPLPPIDEQRRIVAYLDAVQAKADALRWLQDETRRELDALLPSVLDRAFRGEL